MKKNIAVLLMLSMLFINTVHAAYPTDFNVVYQLNKIGMNAAETRITLNKQNKGSWLYNSQTITKGLVSVFRKDKISEQTLISDVDGTPRPVSYQYIHKGSKKNRNRSISFDWKNKIAHTNSRGHKDQFSITDDVIDGFSLQLRIMDDLDEGKTKLEYNTIYKGQLKPYTFEMLGKELIETTVGKFNSIKIKRTRKNGKRTTIMWLATELHYLPVKIQHIEKDGTDFSLTISQISGPITGGKVYGKTTDDSDE